MSRGERHSLSCLILTNNAPQPGPPPQLTGAPPLSHSDAPLAVTHTITAKEALAATGAAPLENHRQERFCINIVEGMRRGLAYSTAGYEAQSDNSARSGASTLMRKPEVQARIAFLREQVAALARERRERVIQEMERIALSDLRKAVDWSDHRVTVRDSASLDDATAAAIAEVQVSRGHGVKVRMHDKLAALKELARIHGAYPDAGDDQHTQQVVVIVAPEKLSRDEWVARYGSGGV